MKTDQILRFVDVVSSRTAALLLGYILGQAFLPVTMCCFTRQKSFQGVNDPKIHFLLMCVAVKKVLTAPIFINLRNFEMERDIRHKSTK